MKKNIEMKSLTIILFGRHQDIYLPLKSIAL